MIGNIVRRLRSDGIQKTVEYYSAVCAWHLSTNYRQNSNSIKRMPLWQRVPYVLWDGVLSAGDRIAHHLDKTLNGHTVIPEGMTEYTIRLLRADLISKDSIIYAFGVSGHIETEEDLAKRHGATVYMFDPTPPALEFMKNRTPDPLLIFDPIGVWTKTGPVKFYFDRRETNRNLSVTNMYHTSTYFEGMCLTLEDIMKKYGHTRIDILKMDIEGSALPVLLHMLQETQIRPTQIVGSLEKPLLAFGVPLREVAGVVYRKGKLYRALEREGYTIMTHHDAEFTAVRTTTNGSKV